MQIIKKKNLIIFLDEAKNQITFELNSNSSGWIVDDSIGILLTDYLDEKGNLKKEFQPETLANYVIYPHTMNSPYSYYRGDVIKDSNIGNVMVFTIYNSKRKKKSYLILFNDAPNRENTFILSNKNGEVIQKGVL